MTPETRVPALLSRILGVLPDLAGGPRKVARFVLDHHRDAALMGIEQMAAATGVSTATVSRLSRALGYEGFPQLRQDLLGLLRAGLAPVEMSRIVAHDSKSDGAFIQAELQENITNLRVLLRHLDPAQLDRVVQLLLQAPRVLVLGLGVSRALAYFAYNRLSPFLRGLDLLDSGGTALYGPLLTVQRGDLLLACTFPRYLKDTTDAARLARDRGATVVAITDGPISPIVKLAQESFYMKRERARLGSAVGPSLILLDALCAATVRHTKGAENRMAQVTERIQPYLHR